MKGRGEWKGHPRRAVGVVCHEASAQCGRAMLANRNKKHSLWGK